MRAVLYARTSSDDTRKDNINLEGQLNACRDYAAAQGWQVVAELAEDARGVSGARWDAPELLRAMAMAQRGEYDVLVAREVDRLSRSLGKAIFVEEELKRLGVNIAYVIGGIGDDTPEGVLGRQLRQVIAEFEKSKITSRMIRGRRQKVERGGVMTGGAGAPYGYTLQQAGKIKTLAVCEEEAEIVRLIFEWYGEGQTIREITQRLSDMRIPTPSDKAGKRHAKKRAYGQWGASTVGYILGNPTYIGRWEYGRYNSRTHKRNEDNNVLTIDAPAIVSDEAWAAAQARKTENKRRGGEARHDFLMRTFLTCSRCGAHMASVSVQSGDKTYLYYRCNAAYQSGKYLHECDLPSVKAEPLDAAVWRWVVSFIADEDNLQGGADKYRAAQAEAQRPLRERLEAVQQQMADIRRQLIKLIDLYLQDRETREVVQARKEALEERLAALERERLQIKQRLQADPQLTQEQVDVLKSFVVKIQQGLSQAEQSFAIRRKVVDALGVRGQVGQVDGESFVDVQCSLGESSFVGVSNTTKSPAGARLSVGRGEKEENDFYRLLLLPFYLFLL